MNHERACPFSLLIPAFQGLPKNMIVELIFAQNYWLNMFPHKDGVYQDLSPRAIITGQDIDYNKHCKLEFGEYMH